MPTTTSENILDSLESFLPLIPSINPKRKYWFVRTNGGEYFKDFYLSESIGIGYNKITPIDLQIANMNGLTSFNGLLKKVEDAYSKHKQPRYVANQLMKFAFDIKAGDIVLVPSESSWRIAIGEVQSSSVEQKKGEEETWDDSEAPAGFRKYKPVKWLDVFTREQLGPKLYASFYSHHIITDLSDKAADIDRMLHAIYEKDGLVYATIEVNKRSGVYAKDLFGLGYNLLELSDATTAEPDEACLTDKMEVKTTIQSPGDMQFIGEGAAVIVVVAFIVRALIGGATAFKVKKQGTDYDVSYDSASQNIFSQITDFLNNRSQRNIEDRKMKLVEERHQLQMQYIAKRLDNMGISVRPEVAELLFQPLPPELQIGTPRRENNKLPPTAAQDSQPEDPQPGTV